MSSHKFTVEAYKCSDQLPVISSYMGNRQPLLILEEGENEFVEGWYHDDGNFYYGHKEECPEVLDVIEWAYLPKYKKVSNENINIGDHCWAIKDDQLLIVLKVKNNDYAVCGEWECTIRDNDLDLIRVINKPGYHESTDLYYID